MSLWRQYELIRFHIDNPGEIFGLRFNLSKAELFQNLFLYQLKKHFESHSVQNGQKSIRLNPILFEASIRMNMNRVFNPMNPSSDLIKLNFQSGSFWPRIRLKLFKLKTGFGFILLQKVFFLLNCLFNYIIVYWNFSIKKNFVFYSIVINNPWKKNYLYLDIYLLIRLWK